LNNEKTLQFANSLPEAKTDVQKNIFRRRTEKEGKGIVGGSWQRDPKWNRTSRERGSRFGREDSSIKTPRGKKETRKKLEAGGKRTRQGPKKKPFKGCSLELHCGKTSLEKNKNPKLRAGRGIVRRKREF